MVQTLTNKESEMSQDALNDVDVKTMLELLKYPDPSGLHPVEHRWRQLARYLISKKTEPVNCDHQAAEREVKLYSNALDVVLQSLLLDPTVEPKEIEYARRSLKQAVDLTLSNLHLG